MTVHYKDQQHRHSAHLDRLRATAAMRFDPVGLPERTMSVDLDMPFPPRPDAKRILFAYDIFPERIMRHWTQWETEGRGMRVGDTIVQQVHLPPMTTPSVKLVSGVRISAIIEEPERIGFSYVTLEGHVERGVSTFTIEPWQERSRFVIHTRSTPANGLARITGAFSPSPIKPSAPAWRCGM